MAIVTTPGGSSTNSFITVNEANAYLSETTLFDTSAWEGLSESAKEDRLVHAALLMKTRFNWIGWPIYRKQALPFPRRLPDDRDCNEAAILVPEPVKKAQAFIALDIVHRSLVRITPASDGSAGPGIKRLSLFGSLDVTLDDTAPISSDPSNLGRATSSSHWIIEQMLSPYVTTIQAICATSLDNTPELLDEVL